MNYVEGYAPVYGGTIPAGIWHDFMNAALVRTPVQEFPTPTIAQPTYTPTQSYSHSYSSSTTTSTATPSTTTATTSGR
jgi:penicillin-binding protein 1A